MANRNFEFNNTIPNGLVFIDPANIAHKATLKQNHQVRNSTYGKYGVTISTFTQTGTYAFSPNPTCEDQCKTISNNGSISLNVSFPDNVPMEQKVKEYDAFLLNITSQKDRILQGRQLSMTADIVAEIIP